MTYLRNVYSNGFSKYLPNLSCRILAISSFVVSILKETLAFRPVCASNDLFSFLGIGIVFPVVNGKQNISFSLIILRS